MKRSIDISVCVWGVSARAFERWLDIKSRKALVITNAWDANPDVVVVVVDNV